RDWDSRRSSEEHVPEVHARRRVGDTPVRRDGTGAGDQQGIDPYDGWPDRAQEHAERGFNLLGFGHVTGSGGDYRDGESTVIRPGCAGNALADRGTPTAQSQIPQRGPGELPDHL